MKILVVCGAGASSTFVALRLRRSATLRGLTVSVTAITESDLLGRLSAAAHSHVDVVLVGPHLAPAFPAIAKRCAEYGAKGRLLPTSIFTDRDGEVALDLALTAMGLDASKAHPSAAASASQQNTTQPRPERS